MITECEAECRKNIHYAATQFYGITKLPPELIATNFYAMAYRRYQYLMWGIEDISREDKNSESYVRYDEKPVRDLFDGYMA